MIPRMRMLEEAYEELKSLDPKTAVTRHFIRQLMITGEIPCIMSGRKRLVNLDILISYLANPKADPIENNKIRRVI